MQVVDKIRNIRCSIFILVFDISPETMRDYGEKYISYRNRSETFCNFLANPNHNDKADTIATTALVSQLLRNCLDELQLQKVWWVTIYVWLISDVRIGFFSVLEKKSSLIRKSSFFFILWHSFIFLLLSQVEFPKYLCLLKILVGEFWPKLNAIFWMCDLTGLSTMPSYP